MQRPGMQHSAMQAKVESAMKAKVEQIQSQLASMYDEISFMQDRGSIKFPEQYKMGIIKYPHLYLQPFTWIQEALEGANTHFATTTGGTSTAQFQFDNIYSFVESISFGLRRTARPGGSVLPLNCWLPLSCKTFPFITANDFYVGKDFRWQIQAQTQGNYWENDSRWRTSYDVDWPGGYRLKAEYQSLPGDTILVRTQALADAVLNETFELWVLLHGYKMVAKSESYNAVK